MKKIQLTSLFCFVFFASSFANAQCTISPFIQQNYELDAKLLVLKEIRHNTNDSDYDNPFIQQNRVDAYLEKLSAIYANPQNLIEIDSLFNEFQFHVNPIDHAYKKIRFFVNTNVSWVQTLKDTGTSGITTFDNLLSQYQLSVTSFNDYTGTFYTGKTIFELTTTYDFLNMYALYDDFQNASSDIEMNNLPTFYDDNVCNYTGINYSIPDDELIPSYFPVSMCTIGYDLSNDYWSFGLLTPCVIISVTQYRYVTVSSDCSTVNFSQTLSTEDAEISNLAIYPNPTSGVLNIKGITNIQQVEIYSILGTAIKIPLDTSSALNTINVSSLKNGVYFLKVTDAQNRVVVRKFIKE